MKARGIFVTGTDTGCGKTEISLGLMRYYQARGEAVLGMKPVASGAEATPHGLRNEDALRLQRQGSCTPAYECINPYCFAPPIAPHLAAAQQGVVIDLDRIRDTYHGLAAHADRVIVEGVGGWRVPLNDKQAISELAVLLGLPVVLVVGLKLGCINHALLSAESILSSGACFAGWVANRVEPGMREPDGNIQTLKDLIPAPCLGEIAWADKITLAAVTAGLDLGAIQ